MSLTAYKSKLVDNVGDKKEDIVKKDTCWVKDSGYYKELSKVNENSSDSEENEKDDIKK